MKSEFIESVYTVVRSIPKGRVMYYSQIAALCGKPNNARQVGQIAHFGPETLPWQRVVKKSGELAGGYWGGKEEHAKALIRENVVINNFKIVNIENYLWHS